MPTDTTYTHVLDNLSIEKSKKDSAFYNELFSLDKGYLLDSASNDSLFSDLKVKNTTSQQIADSTIGRVGNPKLFTLEQDDGVFALLLFCFFCITRIYKDSASFFKENLKLLFSAREDVSLFSQTTIKEFWFNVILIFQSVLIISVIVFDYLLISDANIKPIHSLYTILLFIVTISLFIGLKYVFYRFVGWVFDIQAKVNVWLRTYMLVFEMIGLFAFVPALILIYSLHYQMPVINFLIIIFIFSRFILFYRVTAFFLGYSVNFLYLIAYLCSVEIIPYIFLFYILKYLYKIDLTSLLWL